MPLRKIREVKNLLSTTKPEANETLVEPSAAVVEILPIISYYHPNISLELVTNPGALAYSSLPPVVQQRTLSSFILVFLSFYRFVVIAI